MITKSNHSVGIILFHRFPRKVMYLLLKQHQGHWGFPKGHFEGEETEKETAVREIFEETGLNVKFHDDFRETIQYFPAPFIFKTVIYTFSSFFVICSPVFLIRYLGFSHLYHLSDFISFQSIFKNSSSQSFSSYITPSF